MSNYEFINAATFEKLKPSLLSKLHTHTKKTEHDFANLRFICCHTSIKLDSIVTAWVAFLFTLEEDLFATHTLFSYVYIVLQVTLGV